MEVATEVTSDCAWWRSYKGNDISPNPPAVPVPVHGGCRGRGRGGEGVMVMQQRLPVTVHGGCGPIVRGGIGHALPVTVHGGGRISDPNPDSDHTPNPA